MAGRPEKLTEYTQEEVRQKILELGTIKATAEFYGVGSATIRRKIGDFHHWGVKPAHIKEIRAMAHSHTMQKVADLLGYKIHQVKSTKKLSKGEMTFYMNQIHQWSVNAGFRLSMPEDSEYMKAMQSQNM